MASERFKVLIGDVPPPEPPKEYTKKEKRQNFWLYNKWYFYGGIAVILLIASFLYSVVSKVKPDYQIGIISEQTVPEPLLRALEGNIVPLVDDRNGDGKTVVQLNQYNINLTGETGGDPNVHAANVTRLMGDLQTGESMIYLVDNVKGIQESQGFLAYNDGTYPEEGDAVDYSKMGYKWTDCQGLQAFNLKKIEIETFSGDVIVEDGQRLMENFSMVLRFYSPKNKEGNKADIYFKQCQELFLKLA